MESLIIRVDASTQTGAGHLMRSLALAQAWRDIGGKVISVTFCQSEGLLQRFREAGCEIHRLRHQYPDPNDWDQAKGILAAYPSGWVVLDGYHFDELYQQRVKEAGHRLLVIDDMAHLKHYYADILLNQNLHAEQLHYSCEPYTRLLLGTRYVLLRREFLAWRGLRREIPEIARRVLVTLGGGDSENYTLKVIHALQRSDVPGLEAIVVIGASNPHGDSIKAAVRQSRIPICLVHNAHNMPKLMDWADVAIIAAGGTLFELLFMGSAIVSYVRNHIQDVVVSELERRTIVKHLGYLRLMDQRILASSLQELALAETRREHMKTSGRKIVDGNGAKRLLKSLLEGCDS
jgi:UDP-2,4-diacetamido-2,4,6-trideoxy-beta-L-altropyranose hydrolase